MVLTVTQDGDSLFLILLIANWPVVSEGIQLGSLKHQQSVWLELDLYVCKKVKLLCLDATT